MIEILKEHPGRMPVVLYFSDSKKKMIAPKEMWVKEERRLIERLKTMLGEANVVIK